MSLIFYTFLKRYLGRLLYACILLIPVFILLYNIDVTNVTKRLTPPIHTGLRGDIKPLIQRHLNVTNDTPYVIGVSLHNWVTSHTNLTGRLYNRPSAVLGNFVH